MVTPTAQASPKPAACDFEVRSTLPTAGYTEVGTLTYGSRTLSTYRSTNDPMQFKEAVRRDVCALGGDIVVTQVDAHGTIVRGAVLRAEGGLGLVGH